MVLTYWHIWDHFSHWQEASADGSFIASLVQTVHRDLKAEILCVNDFIRLESEFRHMQAGIEAWLDRKPSVEKLVENRQVLRSLKSKLRHKLADKHDAEEVGTCFTGCCEFCPWSAVKHRAFWWKQLYPWSLMVVLLFSFFSKWCCFSLLRSWLL